MDVVTNGYDTTIHTNVLGLSYSSSSQFASAKQTDLGPYYFTKLLLPLLASTSKARADGSSRIVNLSSSVNHLVASLEFDTFKDGPERRKQTNPNFFYCQSKFVSVGVSLNQTLES